MKADAEERVGYDGFVAKGGGCMELVPEPIGECLSVGLMDGGGDGCGIDGVAVAEVANDFAAWVQEPHTDREIDIFVVPLFLKSDGVVLEPLPPIESGAGGGEPVEGIWDKPCDGLSVGSDTAEAELEYVALANLANGCLYAVGQEVVVGIEEHNVVACGVFQSSVACGSQTTMGHTDGIGDGCVGAVVGEDDLQVGIGLLLEGTQASLQQVGGNVIDWHYDGYSLQIGAPR